MQVEGDFYFFRRGLGVHVEERLCSQSLCFKSTAV